MRNLLSRDLLLGMLIGLIVSLFLVWLVQRQPGSLILQIELPPLFPPQFAA